MTDGFDIDSDSTKHTIPKQLSFADPATAKASSLDEAIEFCVRQLEANQNIDPDDLVSRFPQWSAELAEFMDNWSGMEQFANALEQEQAPPALSTDEGKQFGDYELIEKIGAGGMGVIYKARQISLDRIVAIKTVAGPHFDRDRFRIEAEAAASLTHSNIVPIYEIGEHRDRLFFSMRLIEGGSLRECIEQDSFSFREVAKIVAAIGRAVGFAHQHGILHRDLKPANVLIDGQREPHITDFGLAKQIARDTEITRTGTIMGTPGYMAPEQADGKAGDLTTATDIYGVGAILYALLTGQPPYSGQNSLEILRRVIDESPTAPRNVRPSVPRDLETICLKCLSKEPNARYHSADLLADDLDRYLNHQPVKARPITTSERFWRWCRRNPAIALLSGAVALLIVSTTVSSVFLAMSERNARLREQQLREAADGATLMHTKSAEAATRAQADLCLTNGLWQSKNDSHGEAALWFAEAARLSKNDPSRLRANQLRFQSWFDRQPVPVGAIFMDKTTSQSQPGPVQFRKNSSQLLCRSGSQFVVWDHESDEQWKLHEDYLGLSAAKWSDDGEVLAIGNKTGGVKFIDGDSRSVIWKLNVGERVQWLAFSHDAQFVAIATAKTIKFWNVRKRKPLKRILDFKKNVAWIGFGDNSHQFVALLHESRLKGNARVYQLENELGTDQEIDSATLKYEVSCRIDQTTEGRNAYRPQFVDEDRYIVIRTIEKRRESLNWIDTDSGDVVRSVALESHKFAADVAPDGEHVITGDQANATAHWFLKGLADQGRIEKGEKLTTLDANQDSRELANQRTSKIEHTDRVNTVDINDDLLIATGSWDFSVQLWTFENYLYGTATAKRLRRLASLPHQSRIRHVQFSPDGTRLVTSQVDGLIRVWQLPGDSIRKQTVPVPASGSLATIVDRQHWMTTGMPRWTGSMSDVSVFDTDTGNYIGGTRQLTRKEYGWVLGSCSLPDENLIVTAHANPKRGSNTYRTKDGTSGYVRFWNLSDGYPAGEPLALNAEPRWIAKHPLGSQIAVCLADMSVVLIDTQAMKITQTLLPTDGSESATELTATNSDEPETSPPYIPSGSIRPTHRLNQKASYSPDGKRLVAWSTTQIGLWVWDVESSQLCFSDVDQDKRPITQAEFSPNGEQLVIAGGRNNNVRILDSKTGANVVPEFKHTTVVYHARFNSDGSKVVVASRDGLACVFDVQTGELLINNMSHPSDVVNAAFTPDSRFILTLGFDELRIWHANDGSMAMKPISIPDRAAQLHITFDSRFAIVAGGQNEVVVLDLIELQKVKLADTAKMSVMGVLLSGRKISEGTVRNLATREWFEQWAAYRASVDSEQ